ncbi:MAG: N-acyl homoserine lactonase family protein [Novosphingobium sp.]|nr:N-acyl homoserine lactonase family protein [Novosphingobium sp.]MBO9601584.1 N-acyl homoserine lactonase family protein [Novosphingobium sp.]
MVAFPLQMPGDGVKLFGFTVGHIHMDLGYFLAGEAGRITIPVTAYLIDHPKGLALFDSGLGARYARPANTPIDGIVDLAEGETIDCRLRAIGVDPADVRWIVASHLHVDHAGGNAYFPNATVIVQKAEYCHAFGEAEGDPVYDRADYDTGQPFLRIEGEHDLFGDGAVVVFPTPGHTPGHQSAKIRIEGAEVVLAGDCCSLRRSLEDLRLPEHCHDAGLFLSSLRRLAQMKRCGALVIPSHDPEVWAKVPKGVPILPGALVS